MAAKEPRQHGHGSERTGMQGTCIIGGWHRRVVRGSIRASAANHSVASDLRRSPRQSTSHDNGSLVNGREGTASARTWFRTYWDARYVYHRWLASPGCPWLDPRVGRESLRGVRPAAVSTAVHEPRQRIPCEWPRRNRVSTDLVPNVLGCKVRVSSVAGIAGLSVARSARRPRITPWRPTCRGFHGSPRATTTDPL